MSLDQGAAMSTPENIAAGFAQPENRQVDENDSRSDHSHSTTLDSETRPKRISVLGYITSELTRGYLLERDKAKFTERRQRVYTFMKTPRELEKFVVFGFFQCMDAFLFLFTFLPLRIVLAFLKILTHPCGVIMPRCQVLEPAQICDILKGVILIVSFFIVNYIDTSMMYHLVRGQAVIKLYVFFNMLEMADRLFSSFGQDILDALFWTATEPKDRRREHIGVLPHLIIAIIYVTTHTLLILFQATVLNVAFNSHNKALLTIMMSNNFVEIKGSLFKKIDKDFLYHISCSDVKERFHYVVLLAVVFIRNMTEFSWNLEHVWVIIPDAVIVFVAELVVDWIKHAFILKFNEISADVYQSFSVRLAEDMAANRQSRAFIDYSDLVARRMSFTPIPLFVLLLRICTKSFRVSGYVGAMIIVMLYLCLMTFKVFNSIILLGRAYDLVEKKEQERKVEPGKRSASFTSDQSFSTHSHQSERRASLPISSSLMYTTSASLNNVSEDNNIQVLHKMKSDSNIYLAQKDLSKNTFQFKRDDSIKEEMPHRTEEDPSTTPTHPSPIENEDISSVTLRHRTNVQPSTVPESVNDTEDLPSTPSVTGSETRV